jgi:hypothetical protein
MPSIEPSEPSNDHPTTPNKSWTSQYLYCEAINLGADADASVPVHLLRNLAAAQRLPARGQQLLDQLIDDQPDTGGASVQMMGASNRRIIDVPSLRTRWSRDCGKSQARLSVYRSRRS